MGGEAGVIIEMTANGRVKGIPGGVPLIRARGIADPKTHTKSPGPVFLLDQRELQAGIEADAGPQPVLVIMSIAQPQPDFRESLTGMPKSASIGLKQNQHLPTPKIISHIPGKQGN